jgi:hypothetical protein
MDEHRSRYAWRGLRSLIFLEELHMSGPEIHDLPKESGPRRTPRKSLIVVLPDNHSVSPDLVTRRLPVDEGTDAVDVILACAGQPSSIAAILRRVKDVQVLLAPAGTSSEDLRELAINQAPGDIVTLLSGIPLPQ